MVRPNASARTSGPAFAVKPATGAQSDDGAAFAAEMMKRLGGVPISRWSSTIAGYAIQPKSK